MPNQLTLRIVGDRDEGILEEFAFYAGEIRTLTVQVFDEDNEQKHYVPADVSVVTLTISATPSNLIYTLPDVVVDTVDRSLVSVNLIAAATTAMITGSVELTYTSATRGIRTARLQYATKKLLKTS